MGERMTLVFDMDVRTFHRNPHLVDTPFGRAVVVSRGDLAAEYDDLEDRLLALEGAADSLLMVLDDPERTAEEVKDAREDLRAVLRPDEEPKP